MEQKKFIYEEPQMEVYEMKLSQAILTDSGDELSGAPRSDYEDE